MYLLYDDETNKLIACHECSEVIEEYQDNLKRQHDINTHIIFEKDKRAKKKFGEKLLTDMSLTVYNQSYIPYKYVDYVEYTGYNSIRDLQICKDTLISLYTNEKLSKREEKTLKKAIYLIDDIISDANNYTPTTSELERLKNYYEEIGLNYRYLE